MAKIRKHSLDKFYTKPDAVKMCLDLLDMDSFDSVVEPSAGGGSFSNLIPRCRAFDIQPEHPSIIEQDYLNFNPLQYGIKGKILVVGNPPFGNQSSLIFKFFDISVYADTIAFILPKSFKKPSFQDKIPLMFHLEHQIELREYSFTLDGDDYDVPCIFQVWTKRVELRKKSKKLTAQTFQFVKKSEQPNLSIRRVGVNAGNLFMDTDRSEQSHYFIKTDDVTGFVDKWNGIEWEHDNTAGCNSISKQEIILGVDFP